MSEKQKDIVREYCTLMRWPSLKVISEDTGIHRNRLLRIVKGADMKMSEYELFQSKISRIKKNLHRRRKNFKEELKDLVNLYMEQPLKDVPSAKLRVRKTWMTFTEQHVLASRIAEVESFIESIEQQRKNFSPTKPEKHLVVFWGSTEHPC